MGADRGLLQTAMRAVAGLGVLVAVLAGCTNDPEPIVTTTPTLSPTTSPSASASASPTPTPSPSATALTEEEVLAQIPNELNEEALIPAVRFSRFFVELYPNAVGEAHDYALFEFLSADECAFCTEAIAVAQELEAADAHADGGEFSWPNKDDNLFGFMGGLEPAENVWRITQEFELTDTVTLAADGTELTQSAGGTGDVEVTLHWNGEHWVALGVDFEFDD